MYYLVKEIWQNETNCSASVNELLCDLKYLSDAETPSFPTECREYKTEDNKLKKIYV